jgi:hypothetical protein
MPRLIPPQYGNGKRPSDPLFQLATPDGRPGPNMGTAVVVLDVSDDTHELVGATHDAALDPTDDTTLLTGTRVLVDCPRYVDGSRPGPMPCGIGGSTLHEAATEVIGAHAQLASEMPAWVASTSDVLANVLAEHFTVDGYSTCTVIPMEEVPS